MPSPSSTALLATLLASGLSVTPASAVVIAPDFGGFSFVENKRQLTGAQVQRIQFGVDVVPSSITGPLTATWGTAPGEPPFPGQPLPLTDFGIAQGVGEDPFVVREFGAVRPLADVPFLATKSLQMTVTDTTGSASVVLPPIFPDTVATVADVPFIPLVENVVRTEGLAPMIGWENPAGETELLSLGVDAIQIRVFESEPPLFSRIYREIFSDLTTNTVQLPNLEELSTVPNPDFFARIEYIDFEEIVQIIDGVSVMIINQRNRSTYEIDFIDVPIVPGPLDPDRPGPGASPDVIPLPSTFSMMAGFIFLGLWFGRRRQGAGVRPM